MACIIPNTLIQHFNEIPKDFSKCKGMYLFKDCNEAFWRSAARYFKEKPTTKLWEISAAVVDVTGGGNASSGGFLAGWCESGGDIARAGVCAAVSASFAIARYGVPVSIDAGMMKKAREIAETLAVTEL